MAYNVSTGGFMLSSDLSLINPVYSPIEFILNATVNGSTADYMELGVWIGDASKGRYEGSKRSLRFLGDYTEVNIENICQPFFESDASKSSSLNWSHKVLRMDVVGYKYLNDVETSLYLTNYYLFNGVMSGFKDYEYIFDGSVNAKFLNNWNAPIDLHSKDIFNLYFFRGHFKNAFKTYDASSFSLRIYKNGIKTRGIKIAHQPIPQILRFPVDASGIDGSVANYTLGKIYTIDISSNTSTLYKKTFNIVDEDPSYDYVTLNWIDRHGCMNSFNFDLIKTNTVEVDKLIYFNNKVQKAFNTTVKDRYSITSGWVTEEQSEYLKDLWYSPAVSLTEKGTPFNSRPIILLNKSIEIKKRKTYNLINYTCEYEISDEYVVQKN